MTNKASTNTINSIDQSWSLDSTNNKPYSGASVEAFIKSKLNSKGGEFYFDSETTKYLIFADTDSRDLFLSNRESHSDLLLGSFDAPANYTAEITMTTPSTNVILNGSTGNYVDFTFDIKSKTGSSTGESVIATFTFNNAGNITKETRIYDAGTQVHFLVDEYLSSGTNNVSVSIVGRNTFVGTMSAVIFTVVNLEITSSFNFANSVTQGTRLNIPYNVNGANAANVEWYIDGTLQQDVDATIGANYSGTKSLATDNMTVGKHNIQARAYIIDGGTNYYSNTIYFDFVIAPSNGTWGSNTTYPLLGLVLSAPITSGTLSVQVKQYKTFVFKTAVFDSRNRALNLVLTDNGTQVKSVAMTSGEITQDSYSPTTTGNHILVFTVDGQTTTFTVVSISSDVDISEVTSDLLLKLSAKGRSNNETNPATWTYTQDAALGGNTITTSFSGFDWNTQSGWNNDALVIPAGSSVTINLNPLAGNSTSKGRTIEIDFETLNIDDESASVVNLTNGTTGLAITASTAKLQTAGGAKVETKFRDGDHVNLAFIINRVDDANNLRMLYIVNNGVLERASLFAANDTISISDSTMTIGSQSCTVKLYGVRVYDKALTVDLAFCNCAINSPDLSSIASFNDIYENGSISVDKVNAHIPVMIITGDISSITSISDKSHKNDWNRVPVQIEFRNMLNPQMNFFIDDADIRLQGTSSISYPRKNFRIYSISKSNKYSTKLYTPTHNAEDLVESGKYAFKTGSAPVSCWCLKADFAESSGSHNTGGARLWNNVMKAANNNGEYILRTNAQKWAALYNYPYDVRTTIDGFPIVLFQRDSSTSPLVCLGQYNFNNDKSTEEVYGFTALTDGTHTFDNSKVECWEVLDSDNSIALFTDLGDWVNLWEKAFEARYPDGNTNATALYRVASFINSCYDSTNDTVNVSTWRANKANYFDLNKLAAYYIYLLRFGAVDLTVKNAMFTTEDGEHWFYINYDNDTILGIDNESQLFDTWDYGLFTQTTDGGYYYAGKGKSVLWRLFEADSECITLARLIDALLFKAGLTYEAILAMFDDSQSSQWCERIYNENSRYKYISQALAGKNVLHMLLGSRQSHRHWWLSHRMEKYDNMFGNGTYTTRLIQARATGTVNIPQGSTYKFIPAITSAFGYAVANTIVDAPTQRTAGTEYTSTGLPQETGVGNLIYIYNANNIASIDFSGYISALGSLSVGDAIDANQNSRLTKLILGNGTDTNAYLTAISGLSNIKSLEELDIRGYSAITSIDLSQLTNLHVFKATNSGLTSFAPATGSTITSALLPSSIQTLNFNGSTVASLTYTPTTTLRSVSLRNISGAWDAKSFVNSWLDLLSDAQLAQTELTLAGINWTNMTAEQAIKIGKVGTKNLQGKITLTSLNLEQYQLLVELFGSSVFNASGTFIIDASAGILLTGPTTIDENETSTYTAAAFPVSDSTIAYLLYNDTTLISSQTDSQGNVYRTYGGVTLYEATGTVSTGTLLSTTTVQVRAQIVGTSTYSSYITLTAQHATYPTAVTISNPASIDKNGTYNYTKSYTGSYNATIQNTVWSLSSEAEGICALTNNGALNYTGESAVLYVTNTPYSSVTVLLTCTVTFTTGVLRVGTKNITICLSIPSSITITGDNAIDDEEARAYIVTFEGNYTSTLLSISWELSSTLSFVTTSTSTTTNTDDTFNITPIDDNNSTTTAGITCTATFTGGVAISLTKQITVNIFSMSEYVDLGLPSGTLWCKHNVGATNPEDYGLYFAWGETTGYASSDNHDFSSSNYTASNIDTDLTWINDAANAYMGGIWCVPTTDEFKELYDNTDNEWTTIDGVAGRKFMKKTDHSVYVFFPASGYYNGTSLGSRGSSGFYWSSSWYSGTNAYSLGFGSGGVYPQRSYDDRRLGITLRAVMHMPQAVDLGLSVKWASFNIGAKSPEDNGLYFAWGETSGYESAEHRNKVTGYTTGFSLESYSYENRNSSGDLSSSNDAATQILGNKWRIPTREEWNELKSLTRTFENNRPVFTNNDTGNHILFPFPGSYHENTYLTNKSNNVYTLKNYSGMPTLGTPNRYTKYPYTSTDSSYFGENNTTYGYYGCCIRAVL